MNKSMLSHVIDDLQKHADEVEQNILETEQNLDKDVTNMNEGKPMVYQDSTNEAIQKSLNLMDALDFKAAQAKHLQHPQAEIIEQDMKQLRDRVIRLRDEHQNLYLLQNDWSRIIDEKLVNLENKGFGPDLPTIENEVDEHEIFHSEVEYLASHIDQGNQDLQLKYNTLVAKSSDRQKNLLSLRDYIRGWTIEFNWLNQQIKERIMYDWSDVNLDYPTRKRQYQDFNECLNSKEKAIFKVKEDGEKLLAESHPAQHMIEAHLDALRTEWFNCMSLRVCEANHLMNMDEYQRFQKDVQEIQDLLKEKDIEITQKNYSESIEPGQLESSLTDLNEQTKAMDDINYRVWTLKNRSLDILPLQYRKYPPQELLSIKGLWNFDTDQGQQVKKGEDYTLIKNNGAKWDVKDSEGQVMTAPGLCFIIPPPDPHSVAAAESLMSLQNDIMQKLASTQESLQSSFTNLNIGGPQIIDEQNCPYAQLLALLDQVVENLHLQNQPMNNNYNMLQEMTSIIDSMSFGADVGTISIELEEQTYFHIEVEALAPRINQNQDNSSDLQMHYNNLRESSEARQKNLLSLKDFVERCDEEMTLLKKENNDRIEFDWSNIDYQNRLQHYENFVTNIKGAIYLRIDALQTEGSELISQGHPGQNTIQTYMNEVSYCWEDLTVVLDCEKAHITNTGKHQQISNKQKEFQDECTEINKLLIQQESKLKDIKEVKEIKNDDDEYRLYRTLTIMTDVEKTMEALENRIKKLQELSLQFKPPSNQETSSQGEQSVVALCNVDSIMAKIVKGVRYTLISINYHLWDVKDSAGNNITAPAIFFSAANQTVFPTDRVESLERHWKTINDQMLEIKGKLTSQRDNLRKDDTGVYSEPEMMKDQIFAMKIEMKYKCNICNYIQKQFSMKDKKYKCENEKCGFRLDSHKYVTIDGFIVMKVNNKNITKKIPSLVIKGYLKENNLEHLLEDICQLEDHFMEEPCFEIMYDRFRKKKMRASHLMLL